MRLSPNLVHTIGPHNGYDDQWPEYVLWGHLYV